MIDENMVERVARAIAKQRYEKDNLVGVTASAISRDLYVDKRWTDFEDAARAAIEAMREPTEAMVDAADLESMPIRPDWHWRTMIDAALKEPVA